LNGLELSRRFYLEAVRPILERHFPHVEHAAALIGTGSEVLGYDDVTSQDHQWGPRVQLFMQADAPRAEIERMLAGELPIEFGGYPTNFGPPEESGSRLLVAVRAGPVAHLVEALVLRGYLRELLGIDPLDGFEVRDWLVTPTQRLLEVTAGEVFADPIGELTRARQQLAWYPDDVWLLVMAGHWRRIAQFEHLHGRAGLRGDELGAQLLAGGLVRDLIRLAFLQRRRYPPYAKWLGTAYARLERPERPWLATALAAPDWRTREEALVAASSATVRCHNELGVTREVDPTPRRFHDRPIRVIAADRVVDALRDAIEDPEVRAIAHEAGSIDAVSDNTDVLTRPLLWRRVAPLYDRP
jgi:Domain of unknown function (DUF4037)